MSDNISDLPINEYSNPTSEEIHIMNTLFTQQQSVNIYNIKVSILITLLYIILFLMHLNYKCKPKTFLCFSSIVFSILIYFVQVYLKND